MSDTPAAHDHGHDQPHAVPMKVLLGVFGILLALTVATVAVTEVDLGKANIWIALAVAALKAAVVAMYFMHLRYDSLFNSVVFIGALFFVALFIGIALLDSVEYRINYVPPSPLVNPQ